MPEVISNILCDDIRLELGNKVSYMGVYDEVIRVVTFPYIFPKLSFAQLWRGTGKIKNFKIKIDIEHSDKPPMTIKGEPVFTEDQKQNLGRFMINLNNVKFSKECKMVFYTFFNDESEPSHVHTIRVEKMPSEERDVSPPRGKMPYKPPKS